MGSARQLLSLSLSLRQPVAVPAAVRRQHGSPLLRSLAVVAQPSGGNVGVAAARWGSCQDLNEVEVAGTCHSILH